MDSKQPRRFLASLGENTDGPHLFCLVCLRSNKASERNNNAELRRSTHQNKALWCRSRASPHTPRLG